MPLYVNITACRNYALLAPNLRAELQNGFVLFLLNETTIIIFGEYLVSNKQSAEDSLRFPLGGGQSSYEAQRLWGAQKMCSVAEIRKFIGLFDII